MSVLNATHDPALKSWVESANNPTSDFPIQNLPFGIFTTETKSTKRAGVAIGDQILDLSVLENENLLPVPKGTFSQPDINAFMAMGAGFWKETRAVISALLADGNTRLKTDARLTEAALDAISSATLHLPVRVVGYTDFYASREHATNVGTMFRDPDNALMPNWLHIPIGYNGRASTIVVSGTEIRRPLGQIKLPDNDHPVFSPSRKLDIELEVAAIVGTPNEMGSPVTIEQANDMIFGYVLLNDWSARDIQVWEYQPLGPFQSKAFASTISPWVVTREAMEPFRTEGPEQIPTPLPYLQQHDGYNYDLTLEVSLTPESAQTGTIICETNFKNMYWSSVQQLTHHAISGCAMSTGDMLGSGTISGDEKTTFGSLLELTWNGQNPITLANNDKRTFIEDGDTLTMSGWCQADTHRIGFGQAIGKILPSPDFP